MLKLTICILVVAVVWGSTTSAENIDTEVGYCHHDGLKIKQGETVSAPIGKCYHYKCDDAKTGVISSLTCSEWQLAPGSKCHKSEIDLTKPYPACCPREVCSDEDDYCDEDDLKIKEGETVPAPIGQCHTITCDKAYPPSISLSICPAWKLATGSKCHISETDLTKQYPDCCPQEVCPED